MGLVFGWMMYRFGSLWVTIACHGVWNGTYALIIFASQGGMPGDARDQAGPRRARWRSSSTSSASWRTMKSCSHEVAATRGRLSTRRCSAPSPRCQCDLAFWQGEPAGFALWFYNFSTFRGQGGTIYLEDLSVLSRAAARQGIGKALLQASGAALRWRKAWRGCNGAVLDWNAPSHRRSTRPWGPKPSGRLDGLPPLRARHWKGWRTTHDFLRGGGVDATASSGATAGCPGTSPPTSSASRKSPWASPW